MLEDRFGVEVLFSEGHRNSPDQEIHIAVTQVLKVECYGVGPAQVDDQSRMPGYERGDDPSDERDGKRLTISDPQFPHPLLRQILDLTNALTQFVEHRGTPPQERPAITSGFYPLGSAIQQPDSKRVLQCADSRRGRRPIRTGSGPRCRW